jgi:hypothetical protein
MKKGKCWQVFIPLYLILDEIKMKFTKNKREKNFLNKYFNIFQQRINLTCRKRMKFVILISTCVERKNKLLMKMFCLKFCVIIENCKSIKLTASERARGSKLFDCGRFFFQKGF